MWSHVTARLFPTSLSLADPSVAGWLWGRLRAAFPDALAASLMPDHPHIITPMAPEQAQQAMRAVISGFSRRHWPAHPKPRWQPVPPPQVIADPGKAARQVRYVVLNPSRAGLTRDPLVWPWTTHRDVLGAVADPWVTSDRLASALRMGWADFKLRHHAYVSGDPSTRVEGTPLPRAQAPTRVTAVPLANIALAALAATRSTPEALRGSTPVRRIFVQLAYAQGWRDARPIGALCDLSPRGVRHAAAARRDGLQSALLCLGDPRLTAYLQPMAAKLLGA